MHLVISDKKKHAPCKRSIFLQDWDRHDHERGAARAPTLLQADEHHQHAQGGCQWTAIWSRVTTHDR
jgi:hypothetical protein